MKIRDKIEVHIIQWEEVFYETLDYESKLSLFHIFHGLHEFNFLDIYIYVDKATLLIFDWNKYTSNSIWFY